MEEASFDNEDLDLLGPGRQQLASSQVNFCSTRHDGAMSYTVGCCNERLDCDALHPGGNPDARQHSFELVQGPSQGRRGKPTAFSKPPVLKGASERSQTQLEVSSWEPDANYGGPGMVQGHPDGTARRNSWDEDEEATPTSSAPHCIGSVGNGASAGASPSVVLIRTTVQYSVCSDECLSRPQWHVA
jgi:hypothetical protein